MEHARPGANKVHQWNGLAIRKVIVGLIVIAIVGTAGVLWRHESQLAIIRNDRFTNRDWAERSAQLERRLEARMLSRDWADAIERRLDALEATRP